jgi:hypothetical protein
MTHPLARSLSMNRRQDRTGHSFVLPHLCLPVAFSRRPFRVHPVPFDPLALSMIRGPGSTVTASPYGPWTRTAN